MKKKFNILMIAFLIIMNHSIIAQAKKNEILFKELKLKAEKQIKDPAQIKEFIEPYNFQTGWSYLTDENNKIYWIEHYSVDTEGYPVDGVEYYWINTLTSQIIAIGHSSTEEYLSSKSPKIINASSETLIENGKFIKTLKGEDSNPNLDFKIPDYFYSYYVSIKEDNVSFRKLPSITAKKILTIDIEGNEDVLDLLKGFKCELIKKGTTKETIAGVTDYWYNIRFRGEVGWVFGKFIEQPILPPPAK